MFLDHPFKFIKHDKGKEKHQTKNSEQIIRKQMVLRTQKKIQVVFNRKVTKHCSIT